MDQYWVWVRPEYGQRWLMLTVPDAWGEGTKGYHKIKQL